jgi:hypothetical protein
MPGSKSSPKASKYLPPLISTSCCSLENCALASFFGDNESSPTCPGRFLLSVGSRPEPFMKGNTNGIHKEMIWVQQQEMFKGGNIDRR